MNRIKQEREWMFCWRGTLGIFGLVALGALVVEHSAQQVVVVAQASYSKPKPDPFRSRGRRIPEKPGLIEKLPAGQSVGNVDADLKGQKRRLFFSEYIRGDASHGLRLYLRPRMLRGPANRELIARCTILILQHLRSWI